MLRILLGLVAAGAVVIMGLLFLVTVLAYVLIPLVGVFVGALFG